MMTATRSSALRYYRDSGNAVVTCDATPHRLISMLYDGALERLGRAAAAMLQGDLVIKARSLQSSMAIIEYLRAVLDHEKGGEISRDLDRLYDYMLRRLPQANASNDAEAVREVMRLLTTVKSAWEDIAL